MWRLGRWLGLAAAAFSFSILLQRNFLLEPSAAFAELTFAYRAIAGLVFTPLELAFAAPLRALAQGANVGTLSLGVASDPLIQDGFIVLAVFISVLSRGLTRSRGGVIALALWGAIVALATAVLRSSAGALQPLPDLVPTEVSAAVWDFYKVQLVVIAPLVYLMGAAALALVPATAIDQRRLIATLVPTALAGVPLAVFARAINASLLPGLGIDPFSSYLGVGAALVPALFFLTLAAMFFVIALVSERAEPGAWRAAIPAQIARDLAVILAAASGLLAVNIALQGMGL